MKDQEEKEGIKMPENMVVFNPDVPLYSKQHVCILLRELYDMAEAEAKEKSAKDSKTSGETP